LKNYMFQLKDCIIVGNDAHAVIEDEDGKELIHHESLGGYFS